jgi:hypothetical protein
VTRRERIDEATHMDEQVTPEPAVYHIRIHGHLDQHWSAWFDGMTITHEPDGTTRLTGPLVDQAALYGVLSKARDLGLMLLSVELLASMQPMCCGYEPSCEHY